MPLDLSLQRGTGEHPVPTPYKTTAVFDQDTLPAALRREHGTKTGVWGIIRVIEGQLILRFADGTPAETLTPDMPALVLPEQKHSVEPLGHVQMQVEFYDRAPAVSVRTKQA